MDEPAELTIELTSQVPEEQEAAARLRAVLERWDLRRYLYTTRVRIDASAPNTESHPVLTIRPADVVGDERVAMSIFLHEQMHWATQVLPGAHALIDEMRSRYPSPPDHQEGGARDPHSTWLHFPVCTLHLVALSEVLGEHEARALLASHPFYRWIHRTILDDEASFREGLERHGLVLPDRPPRWGEPNTTTDLGPGGPVVTSVTGHPLEDSVTSTLGELHERFDLASYRLSPVVAVDGTKRPSPTPVPTLGTRVAGDPDAVLAHYLEMQHQWSELENRPCGPLARELEALVPPPTGDDRLPVDALRAIIAACAHTWHALVELIGAADAQRVTFAHPLNGEVYERIAARR